jgi:membrane dipeptidase
VFGYPVDVDETTRALHRDALVLDLHNDLLHKLTLRPVDLSVRHRAQAIYNPLRFDIDLPRLREAGVDALGCLLFAGLSGTAYDLDGQRFWRQLDELARLVRDYPGDLALATTAQEIREAASRGQVALFIGVEGAHAIEGAFARGRHRVDGSPLERLHAAGVRYFGPLWDRSNLAGVAARDRTRTGGLSADGRLLVRALNALGILVDVSHAAKTTVLDLLRTSRTPVFSSHSGAYAVFAHPRNLGDDELRAIGQEGGVVGVIFASTLLGAPWCSIERLCDHIEHVAAVAGPQAVALGSDFDGFVPLVRGIRDVRDVPRITQLLRQRGWSELELRGLLAENFLRYFAAYAGRPA